jgi:hypothetical protein
VPERPYETVGAVALSEAIHGIAVGLSVNSQRPGERVPRELSNADHWLACVGGGLGRSGEAERLRGDGRLLGGAYAPR